jgi:integrase
MRSSTSANCAIAAVSAALPSVVVSPAKPKSKGKARSEAQPYREGAGYAIRSRYKGNDIYLSGHPTGAAVKKAARQRRDAIDDHGAPQGRGPDLTTAAQAMQDYAMQRLRFKKGAVQEAVRINNYLRAARLSTLLVTPLKTVLPASGVTAAPASSGAKASSKEKKPLTVYFKVTLEPYKSERVIANGLHAHRKVQLTKTADSRRHRAVLAGRAMGAIGRADMQRYMDAMRDEGVAPATMKLEQAMWRGLFNYAFSKWAWASLIDNPATQLEMPAVENERKRTMSHAEQSLLDAALLDCRNLLVAPVLTLLRETAMRASEPLEHACWRDVNWERRVLCLSDAKAGKRDVPLSPVAIEVLRNLGPGEPNEPIVKITYDALKKGMERACERAGIKNLHLQDIRRTAATRLALKTGNLFLVKALTGHKTDKMAARYMQVGADDVVNVLHAPQEATPVATVAEVEPPKSAVPTPVENEPASPPMFTLEQMQAMAQLAAQAAVAGLNTGKSTPPGPVQIPLLTLVPPPAPGPSREGPSLSLVA